MNKSKATEQNGQVGQQGFKKPTSADVARVLGISQSTVSLVLNGKAEGRVSAQLQQDIWEAAQKLNYKPNRAAKVLREGRAKTLALVVPQISNPFFAPVYQGAENTARAMGYDVLLVNTEGSLSTQETLIRHLDMHDVDGYVLWHIPAEYSQVLSPQNVVLVESHFEGFHSIMVDVYGGVTQAMNHLIDLGHRRIAHIAALVGTETFQARAQAYQDCIEQRVGPVDPDLQVVADFSMEGGKNLALELLADPTKRPTAIMCDTDMLAVGAYKAVKSLGLRIPEDVSVVGVDNVELAAFLDPELTTVSIPAGDLGTAAARQLIQLLEGAEGLDPRPVFPASLVVRGSTAPPPKP